MRWDTVAFSELVEFPPKVSLEKEEIYDNIPMDVVDGGAKYVQEINRRVYTGGGAKFANGDTIFARITPCLENGKIAQVKGLEKGVGFGSTEFFVFRAKENISDSDFIYYLAKTELVRQPAIKSMVGASGRQRADKGVVEQIKVPNIPLPTQRRIASILSAYDDLIENNLKRIKLLEEKAFLRYKSEFDFFKPSNEINKIPESWSVKRADKIFKINIGKTPPREQSEWFNDEDSKVKWVSIKDINNSTVFAFESSENVTEMAVSKFNMNVAKAHTVLLSFKLTVGKVAITTDDMTTNEAIAHFSIQDESEMCSEYIYFYLKNFPYDSLGSTSSIGTAINSKVVKAMPVLLPPKEVINDYKKDVKNDSEPFKTKLQTP
jgi:type I restriction enzyme S subunit